MKLNRHLIISALLLALSLISQTPAWAVEFGIAHPPSLGSQQQSYFERPDILTVEAQPHPELNWNNWREAHLEAAAAFLELYPTEHLYFLARDAELLYDAVKIISRDEPQTLARTHLLNVSRANMRDAHLLEYLAQEGITAERLRAEPTFQPIFIDTGFSGTIPRVISERMPEDVRTRLKTHLLVSSNAEMPSLRSFLRPVNPALNGMSPSSMHATIVGYEHIARATDRSNAYQQIEGHWHPTSSASASSDGQVNTLTARHYQEDLRAHLQSEQAIATLQTRRALWSNLRENWLTLSQEQWIEYLKSTLTNAGDRRTQIEPIVRDFLEWAACIRHVIAPTAPILSSTQIDLPIESGAQSSNKSKLIAQYPQWKAILENPDTQIPALLDAGQISVLGSILDVVDDFEIRAIALKAIIKRLSQPPVYALAEALLQKLDHPTGHWTLDLFTYPASANYPALLGLAIEKTPSELIGLFANRVFRLSHWANHPELLRFAIEKTSSEQIRHFAYNVFNQAQWAGHLELLRLAIEKTPSEQMRHFVEYVFYLRHWANHSRFSVIQEATKIADPDQRRAYFREQLGPYSWESAEPPALCEQQMLEDAS